MCFPLIWGYRGCKGVLGVCGCKGYWDLSLSFLLIIHKVINSSELSVLLSMLTVKLWNKHAEFQSWYTSAALEVSSI